MAKTYNLTKEQLDFISFMKAQLAFHPDLKKRFDSCLSNSAIDNGRQNSDSNADKVLIHSPQKMIEFLSLFSRDDRFKWYTHKWDMSTLFDIDDMIRKQNTVKVTLSEKAYPKKSGPTVNESTYNQVWNFINFNNPTDKPYVWRNTKFEAIGYGWHSIKGLSKNNPEVAVENLSLENGHQFKDYIRMFKATIEFRTDLEYNDRFCTLIRKSINSTLPKDFEVTFSSNFKEIGSELNIYCDVIGVLCALNTMCNWITKHKTRSSNVNVDLISEEDYYILAITHKGSYFNNLEKLSNPSGDFENLRNRIFSVCDFSMEGDLKIDGQKKGSIIVNALDENTRMQNKRLTACNIDKLSSDTGGVVYKLKLFKR